MCGSLLDFLPRSGTCEIAVIITNLDGSALRLQRYLWHRANESINIRFLRSFLQQEITPTNSFNGIVVHGRTMKTIAAITVHQGRLRFLPRPDAIFFNILRVYPPTDTLLGLDPLTIDVSLRSLTT